MGYTHYWVFKKKPTNTKNGKANFVNAVTLFKKGIKKLQGVKLAGGNGKGMPTIQEDVICFNGKDEESCGTCAMTFNDEGFDFCKTEGQPYDVAVCLLLLCMKKEFGKDFTYDTDGDKKTDEGWVAAKAIFKEIKK